MSLMLIEDTNLITITDAIRAKTGNTEKLDLLQMEIDIHGIKTPYTDVTDYVITEAKRLAKVVASRQNDNTISFIVASDLHYDGTTSVEIALLHAMQAGAIIRDTVSIDFSAVLGDLVTGDADDTIESHKAFMLSVIRLISILYPELNTNGNHDCQPYNYDGYWTAEEVYKYIGRWNDKATRPNDNAERGYCYLDIESKKTRIILLNTCDIKDIAIKSQMSDFGAHRVSAEQLTWLVSTLDLSDKTDTSDWRIVILSHHPLDWIKYTYTDADGNNWTLDVQNVITILDAYIGGSSGSVTIDSETVSYDFSGINSAKIMCTVHGHTHNYICGTIGNNETPRIGIPNATPNRNNTYGDVANEDYGKFGENVTYAKTAGTAEDTAFCVVTIDIDKEIIYADHYGAGYDRVIALNEVNYTITSSLGNYVTSNNDTYVVTSGESYNATLTIPTGYHLSSVTVTMGGTDVTSEVYSNGAIAIDSVSGDVVITVSGYMNKVKTSINSDGTIYDGDGIANNTRLNSSGNEVALSGYVTTGFIEAGYGNTIEIGGTPGWGDGSDYYCYLGLYDENFTKLTMFSAATITGANYGMVLDENGHFRYRIGSGIDTTKTCKYIRISAQANGGDGTDFIVTVDEEIV